MIDKKIASNSRLGFIGLGYLGSRIARRLVAAGFPMWFMIAIAKRPKN